MSNAKSSARGSGFLSARLRSLRADILARGDTFYRVFVTPTRFVRCVSFREVVVALSVARNLGRRVCDVWTMATLHGVTLPRSVTEYILVPGSFPVPSSSKQKSFCFSCLRCERSESAERG